MDLCRTETLKSFMKENCILTTEFEATASLNQITKNNVLYMLVVRILFEKITLMYLLKYAQ